MKKQIRLYNVIFPIWVLMFYPNPPVILITLFGNLAVDALVMAAVTAPWLFLVPAALF